MQVDQGRHERHRPEHRVRDAHPGPHRLRRRGRPHRRRQVARRAARPAGRRHRRQRRPRCATAGRMFQLVVDG